MLCQASSGLFSDYPWSRTQTVASGIHFQLSLALTKLQETVEGIRSLEILENGT